MSTGHNYSWALPYLNEPITSAVEVGSRDALDAVSISVELGCLVIAFEPNPGQFPVCEANVNRTPNARVVLRREALSDRNGAGVLWLIDEKLYANPGATSLFPINFENRDRSDGDRRRSQVQTPHEVQVRRWDALQLAPPQLLLIDVEGAELKVLSGFGEQLTLVTYVVVEVAPVSPFVGGSSFRQVHRFMRRRGFRYVASERFGTGIWKLKFHLFLRGIKFRLRNPLGCARYRGMLDVLYVRDSTQPG